MYNIFFRWLFLQLNYLYWNIFYFHRMKYTLTKHIQTETAVVILNNKIVLQINLTPNVLCPLLYLPSNQHQPIGIKGKTIKFTVVIIIYYFQINVYTYFEFYFICSFHKFKRISMFSKTTMFPYETSTNIRIHE